jgi:hypothetical protein
MYVIFSYDNQSDIHQSAKFYRFIDTLRAMGKLEGSIVECIGAYKSELEKSFIMLKSDFLEHVIPSGYVDNQESFLLVPESNKQPVSLWFNQSDEIVTLGKLVSYNGMPDCDAWTFRPDLNAYWSVE